MELTQEQIKSIAEELQMGMIVYANIETKEIKPLPDFNNNIYAEEEMWEADIKEIEENIDEYLVFENMSTGESFRIMEEFAETVKDRTLQNRLFNSLSRPKPFRHFNDIIDNSGKNRDEWFAFKNSKYTEFVKDQLDRYNNKLSD